MVASDNSSPMTVGLLLVPSKVTRRWLQSVALISIAVSLLVACLGLLDGADTVAGPASVSAIKEPKDYNQRWLKVEEGEDGRNDEKEGSEHSSFRPRIYTFFQHTAVSGMSISANQQLLDAWKLAWHQSGWEPVVLTMDQARKHDRYLSFQKILLEIPFISEYDQLCFYRWLAMSQVGGGFMADLDVLPLHNFVQEGHALPNNGRLTVYDRCVPSLVSGSAVEYQRMAFVILYHAQLIQSRHLEVGKARGGSYRPQDTWSDMLSLFDTYRKDESVFLRTFEVMKGRLALDTENNPWPWNHETCQEATKGKRAVHMSHLAARSSGNRFDDRASLVLSFWKMFRANCKIETIHFTPGPRDTGSSVWEC